MLPALLLVAGMAKSQEKTGGTDKRDSVIAKRTVIKSFKDFFSGKVQSTRGLFSIHRTDDKYYFEIPDSLLGREILVTTRLTKVPTDCPKFPGEIVNTKSIAFYKGPASNLLVKVVTHRNWVEPGNAIAKAVNDASENPIVTTFDIKAYGPENNGSVIDVSDYFKNDNAIVGISADSKKRMMLGGLASDRSYIESMHAFPINIEIRATKTFSAGGGGAKSADGDAAPTEGAGEGGALTLGTATSLMLLPAEPMQQRIADPRIGYFTEDYSVFSDRQQKVDTRTFIVRFRLEPREEDLEKYKRGELVEPKKPIVYYTDPAIPKQWRPYVIAGINAWQKAFEQAGFKNAIVGKEWPENDTSMNLEDARYFVVRYLPSTEKNAQGVQVHDPRSGEILQSYVGWHLSLMRLLHDMYMMQAGALDPKARSMKFDDALMGKLIQYAVTHEIGHTLGLAHNMGSSATVPVEKLRDKAWVEAHGDCPSVMDYARFNFVAQPEDHFNEDDLIPRIGAYDKWAIQWGYRYTGIRDIQEEKKLTAGWITDSLKVNPALWYGGPGRNNDPRSQAEDLGDNAMKASEYGLKNLKTVAANLEQWTKEPNDTYDNLEDMYDKLGGQYLQFIHAVLANIGGVYETLQAPDAGQNVYAIVPKDIQRSATAFLHKEVFETPVWAMNTHMLNKFRRPGKEEWMEKVQDEALENALSLGLLHQLEVNERRFGTENTYTIDEYLTDLEKGIFSEVYTHKQADPYRRFLQKRYIAFLTLILKLQGKVVDPKPGMPDYSSTDIPAILRAHLVHLESVVKAALPLAGDNLNKSHLQFLQEETENILAIN